MSGRKTNCIKIGCNRFPEQVEAFCRAQRSSASPRSGRLRSHGEKLRQLLISSKHETAHLAVNLGDLTQLTCSDRHVECLKPIFLTVFRRDSLLPLDLCQEEGTRYLRSHHFAAGRAVVAGVIETSIN